MDKVPESVAAEPADMGAIEPNGAAWRMIAELQELDCAAGRVGPAGAAACIGNCSGPSAISRPRGTAATFSNLIARGARDTRVALFDIQAGVREYRKPHESFRAAGKQSRMIFGGLQSGNTSGRIDCAQLRNRAGRHKTQQVVPI